jgi:serine/threonine protein kinase
MSPEQARGQRLDKRTDIWAFGCVLYEMLNGRRAFQGGTVSDVIAAILGREPDWHALPDAIPSGIRRLLQRCLDKDAKRRLRDIGDARIEIEETQSAPPASRTSRTALNVSPRRAGFWYVVGAAALSGMVTTIAVWNLKPAPATSPESEARFVLPMPTGVRLPFVQVFGSMVTVSPDGSHLSLTFAVRG